MFVLPLNREQMLQPNKSCCASCRWDCKVVFDNDYCSNVASIPKRKKERKRFAHVSGVSLPLTPEQNLHNFDVVCSSTIWKPCYKAFHRNSIRRGCVTHTVFTPRDIFYSILTCNKCDFQAKQQYEREERKKELKRQRGEDTWMLPEVNERLQEIQDVRYTFFFT